MIFYGLVLIDFSTCRQLKVGKPRLCCFSSKLKTDSFIRSIYHNIRGIFKNT